MEMQFFVAPEDEMVRILEGKRMQWHRAMGFGDDKYRFHKHEAAHYVNAAADIEFNFPLASRRWRYSLPHRFRPLKPSEELG